MKLSVNKINFFKEYYIIYILLFFTPLINFITNNLFFYQIEYFKYLILTFVIFFFIAYLSLVLFEIIKLNIEKFIYSFFFIWYFQFYYREIYNFFDLSFNEDSLIKYLIVFSLFALSIISSYFFKFKNLDNLLLFF